MDDRELASVIWLSVAFVACLFSRSIRSALVGVVRAALDVKVLLPLLGLVAWMLTFVVIAARLEIWDLQLAFPTVAWFVASGLVLLINVDRVWTADRFFRSTARSVLTLTILFGVFINLFPLALLGELVLQPLVVTLTLLALVAHKDVAQRSVERLAETLLAGLGFGLVAFSIVQLVQQWNVLDKRILGLKFVLPIWLTLVVLPFLWVIAVYASYDSAFAQVNLAVPHRAARARVKLAAFVTLRFRLRLVNVLSFYWAREASEAPSMRRARGVMKKLREEQRQREQAADDERRRLIEYAGVPGVDEDGRQLDRREFAETTAALRWVATAQMGWYRNRGGRYRDDILDIVGHDLTRHGLSSDHGITVQVSDDGQRWWAARQAVTGWWFAIGAAGPPPDEWEYDGPEPPAGFPGIDARWGDRPFAVDVAKNW